MNKYRADSIRPYGLAKNPKILQIFLKIYPLATLSADSIRPNGLVKNPKILQIFLKICPLATLSADSIRVRIDEESKDFVDFSQDLPLATLSADSILVRIDEEAKDFVDFTQDLPLQHCLRIQSSYGLTKNPKILQIFLKICPLAT